MRNFAIYKNILDLFSSTHAEGCHTVSRVKIADQPWEGGFAEVKIPGPGIC